MSKLFENIDRILNENEMDYDKEEKVSEAKKDLKDLSDPADELKSFIESIKGKPLTQDEVDIFVDLIADLENDARDLGYEQGRSVGEGEEED